MRRRLISVRTLLLAVYLFAFCFTQSANAAEMNTALRRLAAAADKEGNLNLSWSQSTFSGSQGAALFQAAMNKKYGTKIRINFVPGADQPRIGTQLATEFSAGQKAHTDIYLGAALSITPLIDLDIFQQVNVKEFMPERSGVAVSELDNRFFRIITGMSGVTYNSQLAPIKPTRLDDFLRPEWKGKIASTPYAAGFDVLLANDVWGKDKTIEFVKKLSTQISGVMRCGESERIATGEFMALVMDCTGQDAITWQEKGAPLEQMIARDAAQKRYFYMSVPKHAQNPNTAKLFVTFMLSDEGQELSYKTWKADLHLLPKSKMGQSITALEKQGVKFAEVTLSWWRQHPEIDANRRELVKILTTKN